MEMLSFVPTSMAETIEYKCEEIGGLASEPQFLCSRPFPRVLFNCHYIVNNADMSFQYINEKFLAHSSPYYGSGGEKVLMLPLWCASQKINKETATENKIILDAECDYFLPVGNDTETNIGFFAVNKKGQVEYAEGMWNDPPIVFGATTETATYDKTNKTLSGDYFFIDDFNYVTPLLEVRLLNNNINYINYKYYDIEMNFIAYETPDIASLTEDPLSFEQCSLVGVNGERITNFEVVDNDISIPTYTELDIEAGWVKRNRDLYFTNATQTNNYRRFIWHRYGRAVSYQREWRDKDGYTTWDYEGWDTNYKYVVKKAYLADDAIEIQHLPLSHAKSNMSELLDIQKQWIY